MGLSLYSIDSQFRAICAAIESQEGEVMPGQEELLSINEMDFIEKASAYCAVIREAELESRAINDEAARLVAMAGKKTLLARQLRDRLLVALANRGGHADLPLFKLRLQTSKSVRVDVPADQLPLGCWSRPEPVPDKRALRERLEAGYDIPGVTLVEHTNLRII